MASRLQDVILRGLAADRPLAADVAAGTLYYSTDTQVTEQSDGSVWASYSDTGAGTGGINQLTGDVTAGPGTASQVATIPNDTVTYAKMQNVSAASRVLGRGSASGAGNVDELTIGSGLTMTGTVLDAVAGAGGITTLTGDVTAGPGSGSQAATLANSGVSAGAYTNANITVDAKGRVTVAANGSGGAGTVTTSGSPASGNLTKFSGATAITNADLTGDVTTSGGVATTLASKFKVRQVTVVIGDGVNVITTGVWGDVSIPLGCTITKWRLLADQSGSIVVNIWKDTYANFPPTVADKITASAPPTITTATKNEDSTLSGWTTSIAAGDTLRFNVDSITTLTRVALSLELALT